MGVAYEFLVQWRPSTGDWSLYQYIDSNDSLHLVKKGQWWSVRSGHQLIPIGNYVIDRELATNRFRLWLVDIARTDFLPTLVTQGDLSADLDPSADIIPLGNYLLLYWPATGAYKCRRFDPFSSTLMLPAGSPQNITGNWRTVINSDLAPVAGYVVCRDRNSGACRTWMFDGGNASDILPNPPIAGMQWTIDPGMNLCTLGDKVIAWSNGSADITVYPVDPTQPFPLQPAKTITAWESSLPADTVVFGLTPLIPLNLPSGVQGDADGPGTIPWMRQNIKKIVYLMLENRSFDHLMGDLYSQGSVGRFIGSNAPFDGASSTNCNTAESGQRFYQSKYSGTNLNYPTDDPDHSHSGVMHQLTDDIAGKWPRFYPTIFTFGDGGQTYCFGQSDSDKRWFISPVSASVGVGDETASGNWNSFYPAMFAFVDEGQTYCFGQTRDNNHWFVSPISASGVGDAVAQGNWARCYPTTFPFVDNGQTYCFGQSDSDKRWYISPISANGVGAETANGYWADFYPTMFTFVDGGQTYCFGQNSRTKYWFVSPISANGVGDAVAQGYWDDFYPTMFPFSYDGQTYCFGQSDSDKRWFIWPVSAVGAGDAVAQGHWYHFYPAMFPFVDAATTYCFGQSSSTSWFVNTISPKGCPASPQMQGFVNDYNLSKSFEIMNYYDSSLLDPLTTLAKQFAVSDAWFCSLPGPTDPNRAFSLTGSSFGLVANFESGAIYNNWPNAPRRPSVWDTLWAHGNKDWKLYDQSLWGNFHYTYHLFLEGHIQEVNQSPDTFRADISDFYSAARAGTLPAFSFIEPAWMGNSSGVTANSCHPPSEMEPGLQLVADIYNALSQGPDFDHTLFIITFDEHGGIYDHVPPPPANNAYRHDSSENFDLLGVRVPTLLISPWIDQATVFRPTQSGRHYDATSFLATLLLWQGIPASNWWLGNRIRAAATFESVFQSTNIRTDAPRIVAAPPTDPNQLDMPMHDLNKLMIVRIVYTLCAGVLSLEETEREAREICALGSTRLAAQALDKLEARVQRLHESRSQ
ncbi:alkaline phosphatase family protein [Phyllobacterium leguminum]|uniref:Phosphoesterase family protein n=1 Tax=Phyllobacterium leguminum TaxID=314237 RepID=A0A318T593_9HYPH|nr:alkaline phosphatase family protein [Phyllobacterium leguminum]PYE88192.1 phosphoesterase family protein [Phyllobacterium leguminum]